jgi:hypothetical protein
MAVAKVYTLDADFDEGFLLNVNHDVVADQLQLNALASTRTFDYVYIPCSGRNTLVRIVASTGTIVGEYRTKPSTVSSGGNPSRTASDRYGNVYVGNRDASAGSKGSVTKIGVVVGGTRCNADGTANASGDYLKPPFTYNTMQDKDGDGLLKTSRGLTDIRTWTTDDGSGTDGSVIGADDDAIMLYRRAGSINTRFVAIDTDGSIWVAGHTNAPHGTCSYEHLDPDTFETLSGGFEAGAAGGHGGFITSSRILWSSDLFGDDGSLAFDGFMLRRDLEAATASNPYAQDNHAITQDSSGHVWSVSFLGAALDLIEFSAAGAVLNTYAMPENARSIQYNPVHNDLWVTHMGSGKVRRWSLAGAVTATITCSTGNNLTGIGIDTTGKVWVQDVGNDRVYRINPATNTVDLTVNLTGGSAPYGWADSSGLVPLITTQPSGFWDVVYDHGSEASWGRISWTESTPETCTFYVERRIASTPLALADLPWTLCDNGAIFGKAPGRYVEVRCTFLRPDASTDTPVLFDLTLETLESVVTPPTGPCAGQLVHPVARGQVATPTLIGQA